MRAEQRLSFASEHETDKTGLDREQVRHLPWYRLRVREAACATRPQNLSAPMHEVPGVRKSQKSRGLKQPLRQAAACTPGCQQKTPPAGDLRAGPIRSRHPGEHGMSWRNPSTGFAGKYSQDYVFVESPRRCGRLAGRPAGGFIRQTPRRCVCLPARRCGSAARFRPRQPRAQSYRETRSGS